MTLKLVGLGYGQRSDISLGAWEALVGHVGRRVLRDRGVTWLTHDPDMRPFDDNFGALDPHGDGAEDIARQLVAWSRGGDILYAVPGLPWIGAADCDAARKAAAEAGVEVVMIPPPRLDPLTGSQVPGAAFPDLINIIRRLRDPVTGCPWDLEQTPRKLRRYLIEEAYEVVEAIDSGDSGKVCEELGDLLLQVVFHSQLAMETGAFDIDDVARVIVEKLVRRHPHVFGDVTVSGSDQVLTNWEKIKRAEKGYEDRTSILDGIPAGLPALMRALEVSKRVVKVGFEWPTIDEVLDKVEEELREMRAEIARGETDLAAAELGDLLFTLANVGRQLGVDAEQALREMTMRFAARFRKIELHAEASGRSIADLPPSEMEMIWQAAKREQ